jgi:glutamine amidotransferase
MCRLVGYLGAPRSLHALLYADDHSLEQQSWAPREQRFGTINADGWGVGWYDLAVQPEPARYRTTKPMWTDAALRSMAPLVASRCVLAAVRSATPPSPIDEVNTPPYTADRWLFVHNGRIDGWADGVNEHLRRRASERRAAAIEGSTDSEVLFALVLDQLDKGASAPDALLDAAATVTEVADARLNALLADGETITGLVWGDTMYSCERADGAWLASEPTGDDPSWRPLPDRSTVVLGGES